MRINDKVKDLLYLIPVTAGYITYLFHLGMTLLLFLFSFLLVVVVIMETKLKNKTITILIPLSSGLLCFLMKFFYWDSFDFTNRVNNLLLISFFFSIYLLLKRYQVFKRFMYAFNRYPLKKRLVCIFVCSQMLFIISSYILVKNGVKMGGDEPHYLVIAHSIAKDFDLNVFDQYARNRYREFIDVELGHHTTVGKGFKKWYSFGHLPGLSVTLTPFFFFKISNTWLYFLIRSYLGLFGAMLACLIYLFCLRLWKHLSLSLFITIIFTLTVPIFFFSIHVFAELQALLLILSALYLLLFSSKKRDWTYLLAGFLLSLLVFWGLKYNIFIFLFSAGFFIYLFFIKGQKKKAIIFLIFPLLLQLLFFYYLYFAYGNFSPMSIYNGIMTDAQQQQYYQSVQTIPLKKRVETLLGIFFDQRDGLMLYNPFYLFFFPGLLLALKKYRIYFKHLLVAAAGFIYILFMAFSTVRAGYSPQARYLVPVIWILLLFSVIYRYESKNKFFKKIFYYIPYYSLTVVLCQVLHPFTLYQSATHINLHRPGLMFQQWSNLYIDLPQMLPSFVKVPGNFKYLANLLFLGFLVIFVILSLKKMRSYEFKAFLSISFLLLFVIFSLFPRVPVYNPILISKDGTTPFKILGKSTYPVRAEEWRFNLSELDQDLFTISTLAPASGFVFEFENVNKNNCTLRISNFDEVVKEEISLPMGGTGRIFIKNPVHKRFENGYFYRFFIESTPSPGTMYFQIHPEGLIR